MRLTGLYHDNDGRNLLLLSKGAAVNERDNQGKTALDYAKELPKKEIEKYLISIISMP